MEDITEIDHVEAGLALLPSQWVDKPVINGILAAWLTPLNGIENCALGVRDGFNVNTAIGNQLDIIGEYFDEDRLGRNDTDYRNAILAIISSSNGSGTPDQLMSLFSTLANTSNINFWEHYPLSVALLAREGVDVNLNAPDLMQDASPAAVEYVGFMFDPANFAWIGGDAAEQEANLVTEAGDQIIDDLLNNIVVNALFDVVTNELFRSVFVDSSLDGDLVGGYGINYGGNYGGSPQEYSWLVECVTNGNSLETNGGNGFIEWAEQSEFDPLSGTTNKTKPIPQFQDSGLKRRQPMPRQFFNWMMGQIDNWFQFISDRSAVDNVRMTVDATQTITDYANRFGGTWVSLGTDTFVGETVYVFKRTA